MLPYSLRLALRHFSRKRIYSSIIVMSLTVGFACTCLLVSFLIGEGNVDSFNTKKNRVFELSSNDPFGGGMGSGRIAFTTAQTAEYMLKTYPDVENVCQLSNLDKSELDIDGKLSSVLTLAVDTSFFTMFEFPLIAGSAKGLANGLMITEQKAQQIFGTSDVVGKIVTLRTPDSTKLFTIAGVIGKPKEKSHLNFDALVTQDAAAGTLVKQKPGGITYLMLQEGSKSDEVLARILSDPLRPTLIGEGKLDYFLDPVSKIYTTQFNRMPFMKTRSEVFIWVGWAVCAVILFMASFNFVNLFLLSIQERKKETGIQKTLGISFWQTLRGSAVEAGVYLGISFLLSLILAYTLIPLFNNTLNADLQFDYLSRFKVLSSIGGALLLIAIIVVLTSTLQQRRALPVSMMRNVSAKVRYSKLFFTVQFFVSITLCVCTVTIVKQMNFLENEPLGFNRNILQLNSPGNNTKNNLGSLKNAVSQIPGIDNVALSAGNPISGNMIIFLELEDKTPFNPYLFSGDKDLEKTLGLQLIAGSFNMTAETEKVVNETLVKKFNMQNPIGEIIPGTTDNRIVGVVRDFTCNSFKQEIPPVIISFNEKARNLLVDYGNNDLDVLLPKIKAAWAQVFPDDYFDYIVIQNDLMKKYSEETLFYKIVLSASVTSMIISCFGMFALSWAVIRSRAKEMGIRKVLGASVASILGLLTFSFAKRLVLAFVLAAPAGYYLMNLWLSRFVNKAPIDTWVFVITGISLAAIAVITLGIQTLKASLSSPLNEIKE